jgi:hypothetical protein
MSPLPLTKLHILNDKSPLNGQRDNLAVDDLALVKALLAEGLDLFEEMTV